MNCRTALFLPLFGALCACKGSVPPAGGNAVSALAQEADDLGSHHCQVTTSVAAAQAWFDRGLLWCYGFHHAEAVRCFEQAAAADPGCAMAFWGQAYAAGPNINNMAMSDEVAREACADAARAQELAGAVTPLEAALIAAIGKRYAWPQPEDRSSLDRAYADAMRTAYQAHRDHPDVAALFAEAMMDLRPWDLWQQNGEPQPETPEIVATLERLLAAHPDHPQANHLYIHAVEASPHPERALGAARRLGGLVPGSGHLVHMPAHVFIRVGDFAAAAEANRRAIAVDQNIVARTGRVGFYELYRAHNYHFLVYAAMFEGRAEEAIASARAMQRELPKQVAQELADFVEGYLSVPYHALVRFGRWEEILREPEPEAWQKITRALHCYARGIALAVTGQAEAAAAERTRFAQALAEVPETRTIGNNPARVVLEVGRALLDGEVAFRAGDRAAAFVALREAVRREEALRYDEPWSWMMPPRHALGALLLEAGEVAEAETVYRADLVRHPDNGWALHGLAECLRRRDATDEARAIDARFAQAWARAQVQIAGSCFCRRG